MRLGLKAGILGIALCALQAWAGSAQEHPCPPASPADGLWVEGPNPPQAPNKGFLWTLRKAGHLSFLYGTVHLAQAPWLRPGPLVEDAMRQASRFAVELDISSREVGMRLMQALEPPVDPGPASSGEARLQGELDRLLKAECVDESRLRKASVAMKVAWLIAVAGRRDGLFPDFAIDRMVIEAARRQGRHLTELETPQEQAAVIRNLVRAQLTVPDATIASLQPDPLRADIRTLAFAWARSDLDTFEKKAQAGRESLRPLLSDRNPTLAHRLVEFYESTSCGFAAIGALHMAGPDNVLAHLREAGYEVMQLWPPGPERPKASLHGAAIEPAPPPDLQAH